MFIDAKDTPHKLYKRHCLLGPLSLKRYVHKRLKLKEKEADAMYNFMSAIMSLPEAGEKCLHYIFQMPG
jgi:hypothetical protein